MERLARLEVDCAVLHLHEDVGTKLAVELRELDVGPFGSIGVDVLVVDERAPDDVAAVRRERIRQHVGPFRVGPPIVLGTRLPLGVGLDGEAPEVRDRLVDFRDLRLPPLRDPAVEWIGCLQPPEPQRGGDVGREVHPDAVRSPHIGDGRDLREVLRREDAHIRVDVVDDRTIDANRGVGAGVVRIPRADRVG
jgi:hypothetical protein